MNPTANVTVPLTDGDLLHRVIDLLEAALDESPGLATEGPILAAVITTDRGVELGVLPLAGEPAAQLRGFRAPAEWWAAGIVASGRARCLDDPRRGTWPVEVIHLVARSGVGAAARRRHAASVSDRCDVDGSEWSGLVDDHLRRVLGLATVPAPTSTLEFWTARWLDALCCRAARGELAGAPWSQLAADHPARRLAARAGAPSGEREWRDVDLVRAGELLARRWSWPALRAAAGTPADVLGTMPADVAAWMDDGLFARVHLAEQPEVADLLDVLSDVLAPSLMTQLQDICRAWSIQR